MGKVVFDISMSLDGFITAANARPDAGLGDGGERLHDWGFHSTDPRDHEIMAWYSGVGVNIFGRTGYDHSIRYWGADGPSGPARIPTVIVSHSVPDDVPEGGVFTFAQSIDSAMQIAQRIAGEKDVYVTGAGVAQQFLRRGFIDEVVLHVVPVLFGSGTRLFEPFDGEHVSLEIVDVIRTAEAVHMRFRVVK